uniref:Uncharacterized protein n=1 Tax=Glossina austeni TaxID=7395 RepID=A0A1A9UHD7_GLOAU
MYTIRPTTTEIFTKFNFRYFYCLNYSRVLYNIPLASPRSSRSTASGDKSSIVLQHKVLFVLIGLSISGEMIAPAKAEALSKRIPIPSPERNTSKRPANVARVQFLPPFDDGAELSNHVRTNAQHFPLCLPVVGPQCDVAVR